MKTLLSIDSVQLYLSLGCLHPDKTETSKKIYKLWSYYLYLKAAFSFLLIGNAKQKLIYMQSF